jgi:hypothetical protein
MNANAELGGVHEADEESRLRQIVNKARKKLFEVFYTLGTASSTSTIFVVLAVVAETLQLIGILFPNDNALIPWRDESAVFVRSIAEGADHVLEK